MNAEEKKTYEKHYGKLIGKSVKRLVFDGDEVFGLQMSDGKIAWILCDPEGNGPGFLDVQER